MGSEAQFKAQLRATVNAGDGIPDDAAPVSNSVGEWVHMTLNSSAPVFVGPFPLALSALPNVWLRGWGAGEVNVSMLGWFNVKQLFIDRQGGAPITIRYIETPIDKITMVDTQAPLKLDFFSTALSGTADTLALNLLNYGSAVSSTPGFYLPGYETINLSCTGTNWVGDITMGRATTATLNISGTGNLNVQTVAADVIDASALRGNLLMSVAPAHLDSLGVTILGGYGNDRLRDSAGRDVISGGAGNDELIVASGPRQADVLAGGTGLDQFQFRASSPSRDNARADMLRLSSGTDGVVHITDFVHGQDKIVLSAGLSGQVRLAPTQTLTSADNLAAVYAGIQQIAASATVSSIGGWLWAGSGVVVNVESGNAKGSYVYINDATASVSSANDMLIEITGISGGALSGSDFIVV